MMTVTRHGTFNHRRCCWRKRRHRTEAEAILARAALRRKPEYDGKPIAVYECSCCGGWHLGHAWEVQS